MDRTTRTWAIALAAITTAALTAAPAAQATPQILKTEMAPPVVGKPIELRVTATDNAGPVTGIIVGFGTGQGGFGSDACGPISSSGNSLAAPGPSTVTAPHTFTKPGPGVTTLRLKSAGCTGGVPSVVQEVHYTVTRPGEPTQPVTVGPPVTVPLGQKPPVLPGVGQVPVGLGDLPVPAVPALPEVPKLPSIPGVTLPGLGARSASADTSGDASAAGLKAACPNAAAPFVNNPAGQAAAQKTLFCLMNAERSRRGLHAIKPNARLLAAAVHHSRAMIAKRFFDHVGPGSLNLKQRLTRAGYPPRTGRWQAGENIGYGWAQGGTPLGIHRAWMHSTLHRRNILYPTFREAGFGIAVAAPFGRGVTYTTNFGARG